MDINILRTKKESKIIISVILLIAGMVNTQAKNYTKLKLKIVWPRIESKSRHLTIEESMNAIPTTMKGNRIKIMRV